MELEVFTQPLCPYSYALKHLLTGHGVAFVEQDIVTNPEARKAFFQLRAPVVPVFYDWATK